MISKLFNFLFFLTILTTLNAHPTGNMVVAGDNILWSYVNPVKDKNHYACVMIKRPGQPAQALVTSKYSASDYMIFTRGKDIYLIESRYVQSEDKVKSRLLRTDLNGEINELWPWFDDKWNTGRAGFYLLSEKEIIFNTYPNIYIMEKGRKPEIYFSTKIAVKRLRYKGKNKLLLLGDSQCWLTDDKGKPLKKWLNLIDSSVTDAPLNRNQVFDVDYDDGRLLLAYWGKRSFELIDTDNNRQIIEQQSAPRAPHWVAFKKDEMLLFSSRLDFTGNNPLPHLLSSGQEKKVLWMVD